MDLAIIGTAFSHLKTSIDIAKLISDSTSSLSEAETKLKLAELISSLADLKMELADIKVNLIDKDEVIRELNEKLKDKSNITFDGEIYRKENDGQKEESFCPTCYDVKEIKVRLHKEDLGWRCRNCKEYFGKKSIPPSLKFNDILKKNKF